MVIELRKTKDQKPVVKKWLQQGRSFWYNFVRNTRYAPVDDKIVNKMVHKMTDEYDEVWIVLNKCVMYSLRQIVLINYELFLIFRCSMILYNQPLKDAFRVMPLLPLALCTDVLQFLSYNLAAADVTC